MVLSLSLLLLLPQVQGFGYSALELTIFEEAGFCLSSLDLEVYIHDCNVTDCSVFDHQTCWAACQESGVPFTNVDYWWEDASCYCQNDCLCLYDPVSGSSIASDRITYLPESCCGSPDYGYGYYTCNGTHWNGDEHCVNGDLDSCLPGWEFRESIVDACEEFDDGTYYAYICNADGSISGGNATTCNVTDPSELVIDWDYPSGWSEVLDCVYSDDDDGTDDGRRRLVDAHSSVGKIKQHKGKHKITTEHPAHLAKTNHFDRLKHAANMKNE